MDEALRNHTLFETVSDEVQLPTRQTVGSAGYDFYAPRSLTINSGEKVVFDSGVIAHVPKGCVLLLFPRSSLGSKGIVLTNTVGVIDSDYNREVKALLTNNNSYHSIHIDRGERYMQGVLIPYVICDDKPVSKKRSGGMGSTGK